MNTLLVIGLTNAVLATVLAVVVGMLGRVCRRPALMHSLWLVVLMKLITPPLLMLPIVVLTASIEPPEDELVAASDTEDATLEKRAEGTESPAAGTGAEATTQFTGNLLESDLNPLVTIQPKNARSRQIQEDAAEEEENKPAKVGRPPQRRRRRARRA